LSVCKHSSKSKPVKHEKIAKLADALFSWMGDQCMEK
jgi:hypothetical protein